VPAAEPIGGAEAADLFRPLEGACAIALAVSGGQDSIALLALAAAWAGKGGRPEVHVLTVDHGLRAGSRQEAEGVAAIAARFGISARVLRWEEPKPETGIEEAAREARYRLLVAAAKEIGASHLVTAHHLDDQAETFLMRLARGSGPFGLAGMRRVMDAEGITVVRPFLAIPKARLAETARAAGLSFVEDPMNLDPRFQRARWRRLAPDLAAEGLHAQRLGQAAARMARVADAIDHYATGLIKEGVAVDAFATARLDLGIYAPAPAEVRLRTLVRLLRAIGGSTHYPPRLDHLEGLDLALMRRGERPFRRTLARVVADGRSESEVLFYREIGRRTPAPRPVRGRFDGVWDNRFAVSVEATGGRDFLLGALGRDGVSALDPSPDGVPAAALAALPGLRLGERIIAPSASETAVSGVYFTARSILAERLLAA
jgi:tRNA(Ile)-lysidine synthase